MTTELYMPRTNHRKMMLARAHYRLWWGAVETLTISELKREIAEKETQIDKPCAQVYETKFDIAVQEYLKKQEKEEICAACGVYKKHPKPPRDWTCEDKVYCCLYCRDTKGTSHGKRCIKCIVSYASDENNGY